MTDKRTTPLRATWGTGGGDPVRLRATELDYLDGGERAVLDIVQAATDLSSLSDELAVMGDAWAETYHVAAARANVVRGLRLGPDDVVLEIGAGCGAITRYLGETCGVVDALEPVGSRAAAARARTRDLANVEVFVGELSDVPMVETYDVVVVVGVLEYIGFGDPERAPYEEFLGQITGLLRPGGSLVLAIENQLGVKYLVGAPEDHTDRAFDSLEGYPHGGRARTFSRATLTSLVEGAGLEPHVLSAFPDYKMTRAVFDPERLTGEAASLQHRVPVFPSPDWGTPRLPIADEKAAWRTLVGAGLAAETPNSFVVVAGKGGPSPLWTATDAAVYYSSNRFARFAVETRVESVEDTLVFSRRHLAPAGERARVWIDLDDAAYVPGVDLTELFVDTDDEASAAHLRAWRDLVLANDGRAEPSSLDLVPHNLVVGPDGSLVLIDDEWRSDDCTVESVLRRGVLTFALRLVAAGDLRGAWNGCATVEDVLARLGACVGLEGRAWIEVAVRSEAELHASIAPSRSDDPVGHNAAAMRTALAASIREPRPRLDAQLAAEMVRAEIDRRETHAFIDHLHADIGALKDVVDGLHGQLARAQADNERVRAEVAVRDDEIIALQADVQSHLDERAHLVGELESMRSTLSWRLTRPLRAVRRGGH